ncbi:MAG: Mut7-C ubiquitin/RNAse domain-containing protein [Desulfohalobiaceae bacterium]|nr:Mut7-C ubiquitin/RNAse domain-containing protein [Desulfohalobiaceae bacterium]
MQHIELTFLGELNDFLGSDKSETTHRFPLRRRTSVKDLIEAMGPPHPEVGGIEARGESQDFSFQPEPGERIRVTPLCPPVDVRTGDRLHPEPLSRVRFVVDVNVGRLARKLRLLGFDAAYHHSWDDEAIAELAAEEGRIVLSKDIALLKRRIIVWGRYLRAEDPAQQLLEVLSVFGLRGPYPTLTRCLDCNAELEAVDKEAILHLLEPKTKKYYHSFSRCPSCGKIYWAGSHQERIMQWLRAYGLNGAGPERGN